MALTKEKLGRYLALTDLRNSDGALGEDDVRGISTGKVFISTKADLTGVNLLNYKVVMPGMFAYVADTSRRGDKISLAYNDSEDSYLVSSISTVFSVSDEKHLLSDYLYIYFNRPEFDRFARFNSWGSARETFDWDTMCDIDIELPSVEIQQKFVNVYKAMVANQKCYENGLSDLKLTCDAYINNMDYKQMYPIRNFIERNTEKNQAGVFNKSQVKGFDNEGNFIKPMRLFSGKVETFKIIKTGCFVYNSRVNSTIKKLSIAFNEGDDLIVTPAYESFYVSKPDVLYPYYLYMLLQRESFARKVLFNSFGSATLFFDIYALGDLKIPVPDINVQKSIASIYKVYKTRQAINERLKMQIKDICPILIRGSLQEGGKTP